MIKVYTDADFNNAYKQKNTVLNIFLGVLAGYLAVCIGCVIAHASLPYAHPNLWIPKWISYLATVAFVGFAFPFMGIKYRRVNKYYKMLYYVSEGIKNEEENYFVKFENSDLQKDNVDALVCVFMTWNRKKQEWMKREAYFDCEKQLPDFSRGDLVRYVTQSNFIIQYDILQKQVLEIEEINEYNQYGESYYDDEEVETGEVEVETETTEKVVEEKN